MAALRISQVAGPLKQNERFEDWFESSQPVAVPFFDGQQLPVLFSELPAGPAEACAWLAGADAALGRFLALGAAARQEANSLVMANYQEMLDMSDIYPLDVSAPADIWHFVHPMDVAVTRDYYGAGTDFQPGDFYVQVACECEWEVEHGLQLVFREGRMLTRVSEQDGHLTEGHAYARSDEQDPLMVKYYATYGRPK